MDKLPFDPYDFFGYLACGLAVVIGMELTLGFPKVLGREFGLIDSLALLLAVYVTGQMVATPAKALLEDILVGKLLGRPSDNLVRESAPRFRSFLFPGFFAPLPYHARAALVARAQADGVERTGEDLFLHVRFAPEVLANDKLMVRLDSFLNKYGFSRNLSFACLAVGVALAIKSSLSPAANIKEYATVAFAAGVLLLYRYLKFFRQYSYELFNFFARAK
jgi:hypothetical protein